jgi:hypothetical protein
MTLPTLNQDFWKPATETEKLAALASLAGLPSRQTSSAELDKAAFFVALDGVTRWGLAEAVKAILRNSLGHAFFPSPPELRGQCDKAMIWHEREADRIRRQEREAENHVDWRPPTEAEKAKARQVYAEFCKGYEKAAASETLRLDPALVALVPDNPKSMARQRMGAEE